MRIPDDRRLPAGLVFFRFSPGGLGSAISPRYSSDASALATLIGAVGHLTVIDHDISGLAMVIGFKKEIAVEWKPKSKAGTGKLQ